MNGLFVTFEGGEGSGKSTVSKLVAKKLEDINIPVLWTREPGGTPISEKIRDILLDPANSEMKDETEALLYAASRAQHTQEKIVPALIEGKVVLCDRYIGSSIAYQGYARDLGADRILDINKFGIYDAEPDIEFFIDTPVPVAMERIKNKNPDRLEALPRSFHEAVYDGFCQRADNTNYVYRIDGTKSPDQISDEIVDAIRYKLASRRM